MPFNTIAEFEKSFPAIKNLTTKQKRAALAIFNRAVDSGDDEGTAIAKAIGVAKNLAAHKDNLSGHRDNDKKKKKASEHLPECPRKRRSEHRPEDCPKNVEMSEGGRILSEFKLNEHFKDKLLTEKKFEILRIGEFFDQRYGKFKVTEERLMALKKNFDDNVLDIDVAIDLNHDPTTGAFAWIEALFVEGGKLLMTLKDITDEGKKIFKEKVFKYFSVEFAPFETVVDGKKTTIKDVLRGVALTNRPVIKGMQPTFLSEDFKDSFNLLTNNNLMSIVMKLAEDMLSRNSISLADAKFLRTQYDEAEEAEKSDEAEKKVAEAEAKAEKDSAAADADEAEGESSEEPAEGKEKPEAGEDANEPDAVDAAELGQSLAEANRKIAILQAAEASREATERVEGLTLSETTPVGFHKNSKDDLHKFIKTLSESQFAAFTALVPKVVDSSKLSEELGDAGDGISKGIDGKINEAAKLAEQYEKEGLAPHDAIEKAQKAVGLGK